MMTITQPTLLLDRAKCMANISRMHSKASQQGVRLIPHFKTHQSKRVGEWFKEAGIKAITVSSLKMADYFAKAGWENITIAFPVNIRAIDETSALAEKVNLTVFLNSLEALHFLGRQLNSTITFYIEIDTGYGRSGINYQQQNRIKEILHQAKAYQNLEFTGFYTHPGHTYHVEGKAAVTSIYAETLDRLLPLKEAFVLEYPTLQISIGDTPGASLVDDLNNIDSIRPGNFVYYDLVMHRIGACQLTDIAICLAAPIVEVHPAESRLVVHAGWVQLGKDSLPDEESGQHFGYAVLLTEDGWNTEPIGKVISVSQEHGIIKLEPGYVAKFKVGDLIGILPVHACATAQMMGEAYTLEGEFIEMMK